MDALCGAYELLGTDDQLRAGVLQEVVPAGTHVQRATELACLIARQGASAGSIDRSIVAARFQKVGAPSLGVRSQAAPWCCL